MTIIPELRFPEFEGDGEWVERNLGEIGEFIGGGTPSTSNSEYWDGNILWYTPTEVKNGILNPSVRTITKVGLQNSSAKLLPVGTILITTRATIGDVAIANKECTTNQGFQSLVVKTSEHNQFWYYWIIHHKPELERRSSGSTFKEIGKTEIKIIPALSPKKQEQQKIASCLSSLDELLAAHNDKLDALKDHKKGLLQNLFPQEGETVPKVRSPEFEGDGEWVEKKLGEVYSFLVTNSFSRAKLNYEDGEVKNIHYGDIHTKFSTLFDVSREDVPYINPDVSIEKIREECYCVEGDIIFADASEDLNDVGKSIEIINLDGEKLVSGLHTLMARQIEKTFEIGFGGYLFKSDWVRKQIQREAQGAKVLGISTGRISNIKISFPRNLEEQHKIASCLSAVDELITAQQDKIEQLQQHKKGLMQGLFPKMSETGFTGLLDGQDFDSDKKSGNQVNQKNHGSDNG